MNLYCICIVDFKLWTADNLPCTLQSTCSPCEHWTTVKKNVFFHSQRKASKLVSVKINNGGTLTRVDSDILNKKRRSLTSQKVCLDWEQECLFTMIYFLLEIVIRCAQVPVDCLRASKLVTLGYLCFAYFAF